MLEFFKRRLEKLLLANRSASVLAYSFCVGTFIAITPTIPIQTPLVLLLCWLFKLDVPVSIAALYVVNNPITMFPIYVLDYAVGVWFFEKVVQFDLVCYNPAWVAQINAFLSQYIDIKKYLGADFCIWYLMFGGILFGLLVSVPLYPILKKLFEKLIKQIEKKKHEDHKSE